MWFKRIAWFVLTNIAFMVTISAILFVVQLFFPNALSGLNNNANIGAIAIYSGIVGFTSAFLSLIFSKQAAKFMTKTKVIKENQYNNEQEQFLFNMIKNQSERLGLKMPEVGIYQDSSPNAFATGMSKNNSLVSFSSGLLNSMTKDEIEGVAAHEMAHISNGDMVTLTLIQGVVNTFIFAVSRIATNLLSQSRDVNPLVLLAVNIGLQIVLGILCTPIVAYFSRIREYRADAGSAQLVGKQKMIQALTKLKTLSGQEGILEDNKAYSALAINNNKKNSIMAELFSTHPPIEKRIKALS